MPSRLDERGHEILDDTPVAIPVRLTRPPTLTEQMRQVIRGELSRAAAAEGYETFEEADDFDVDDDFDPQSPWEMNFDQERSPLEFEAPPTGAGGPAPAGNGQIQPSGKGGEAPPEPASGGQGPPSSGA